MLSWWRRRRREKILERPFPRAFRKIIASHVGYAQRLDDSEAKRLEELVQVFLEEKSFEGCGGLQLTDEIRVTVAANACILLLGLDHDLYSGVESILVYPSAVRRPATARSPFDTSVRVEGQQPLLSGEAHLGGPVIVVWDSVLRDSRHPSSGHNVVFHEFAHKLDMLDREVDGTPPLSGREQYQRWSAACSEAYLALRERVAAGEPTFLDPYGAQSEGEFFAVVTEHFFEQPRRLLETHPALYDVLRQFYAQDPASRAEKEPS